MFFPPEMWVRKTFTVAGILSAMLSMAWLSESAMASCGDYLFTRSTRPGHFAHPGHFQEPIGVSGSPATATQPLYAPGPGLAVMDYSIPISTNLPFRRCDSPGCHQAPLPLSVPSLPAERFESDDRIVLSGNRNSLIDCGRWQRRDVDSTVCALPGFPVRLMIPPEAACCG